ncbi:hypothetical protein RJ641_006332 [Dillenia turbinata]|uniref:Uncharacterized protein n=1 Tax=Dillenia turbinata TaxID=194707 RepID=A0AAN8VCZ9_9MAGN
MGLDLKPASTSSTSIHKKMKMMIEKAEEELEILEAQHPNRFDYLKIELKSFISSESQKLLLINSSFSSSSSVSTQASSSRKRKQEYDSKGKRKLQKSTAGECNKLKRMDRTDLVIEKAQACLQKIQDLKATFF